MKLLVISLHVFSDTLCDKRASRRPKHNGKWNTWILFMSRTMAEHVTQLYLTRWKSPVWGQHADDVQVYCVGGSWWRSKAPLNQRKGTMFNISVTVFWNLRHVDFLVVKGHLQLHRRLVFTILKADHTKRNKPDCCLNSSSSLRRQKHCNVCQCQRVFCSSL